jgi:Calpain family cysteine protease
VGTLAASYPSLLDKICVARDEESGVYGFVFFRDESWISTVVDDNLYLRSKNHGAQTYDHNGKSEREWKELNQTGSRALHFANSTDQNKTWLPLMEKAYAKVHGDYEALTSGRSAEALEDLTGGVSTVLLTNRILSRDKAWKELLNIDGDFIFCASTRAEESNDKDTRGGIPLGHAYSILQSIEEGGRTV